MRSLTGLALPSLMRSSRREFIHFMNTDFCCATHPVSARAIEVRERRGILAQDLLGRDHAESVLVGQMLWPLDPLPAPYELMQHRHLEAEDACV